MKWQGWRETPSEGWGELLSWHQYDDADKKSIGASNFREHLCIITWTWAPCKEFKMSTFLHFHGLGTAQCFKTGPRCRRLSLLIDYRKNRAEQSMGRLFEGRCSWLKDGGSVDFSNTVRRRWRRGREIRRRRWLEERWRPADGASTDDGDRWWNLWREATGKIANRRQIRTGRMFVQKANAFFKMCSEGGEIWLCAFWLWYLLLIREAGGGGGRGRGGEEEKKGRGQLAIMFEQKTISIDATRDSNGCHQRRGIAPKAYKNSVNQRRTARRRQ